MLFNSLLFAAFLPLVLALSASRASWRTKKLGLLAASFLFYAAWNPAFVLLLLLSTAIDWHVGNRLARAEGASRRRALVLVSLCSNLGLLAFFKYGNFALDSTISALATLGLHFEPIRMDILLPVGISFYTFQTLSYTLDIYRRELEPAADLVDFALYVSFFPQLVAGPIVRASEFLPQLRVERRATADQVRWGFTLLVIGLFQKVVLADQVLAPVVDRVYLPTYGAGALEAWIGTFAFAGQIFFDFAGYSLCAIGVAMMVGFELPDNFRRPYGAIGFSDFWRRWHISLSTWLRDYLYISLGGNRRGPVRTYVNLALTMLLGGLWHGAAWRFVVWGGLHGLYLVVERALRPVLALGRWTRTRPARLLAGALTFALVCVAWVFFRAADFDAAMRLVGAMFGAGEQASRMHAEYYPALGVVGLLLLSHGLGRNTSWEQLGARLNPYVTAALLAVMLFFICISSDSRAFIYFQF